MLPAPAAETTVYLSRWKVPLLICWFSLIAVGGAFLLLNKPLQSLVTTKSWFGYGFGWLLVLGFTFCAGRYAVLLAQNRPVLRLGGRGIQLGPDPLDPWSCIWGEQVVVSEGRVRKVTLHYFTPSAKRQLDITDCNIGPGTLRELLAYYRQHAQAR